MPIKSNTNLRRIKMNTIKKLSFCICMFILSTIVFGIQANAAESCGDKATYEYDTSTGTLTISGTGVITKNPWKSDYQTKIQAVTIKSGITKIDNNIFDGCSALLSVELPETLKEIGSFAFAGTTNLKSITIPKSVTNSGTSCFNNSGLQIVKFSEGLSTIPASMFRGSKSLTTITFPKSLRKIDGYAFYECSSLLSVSFPEDLNEIGSFAFAYTTSLTDVTIPEDFKNSGASCFSNSGLETVIFEEGLTAIPSSMFRGSDSLRIINFPESLKKIGDYAFYGCSDLVDIELPEYLNEIGSFAFAQTAKLKDVTIPKNVTKSGTSCFSNSGLKTLNFEEGLTAIPSNMFRESTALTSIKFPKSLKKINNYVFYGCSSLKTVTLSWYLNEIGICAFANCKNLSKISIYQNVTKINNSAFDKVTGLTILGKKNTVAQTFAKKKGFTFSTGKIPALKDITYTKGNLQYAVIKDLINGKGTVMVLGLSKNVKSINIPKTVKLESYNYKVVEIDKNAFEKKASLKTINIKATTITSMGSKSFAGIHPNAIVTVPKKQYNKYQTMLKKAGLPAKAAIKKK